MALLAALATACGTAGASEPASDTDALLALWNESRELDRAIAERIAGMPLRPAAHQPKLGGLSRKVLLEDDAGHRWLFKEPQQAIEWELVSTPASQELFALCGLDVPHVYPYTYEGRRGTVQIFVQGVRNLSDADLSELTPENLSYLARHQVVDWLVADIDQAGKDFIRHEETLDLWGIDKNGAFDELRVFRIPRGEWSWIYDEVMALYRSGALPWSSDEPQGLVQFLSDLPPSVLTDLFAEVVAHRGPEIRQSLAFKQATLLVEFGQYYSELASDLDRSREFRRRWPPGYREERARAVRGEIRARLERRIERQRAFLAGERVPVL